MIVHEFPEGVDLYEFFQRPAFQPRQLRRVADGVIVTVISAGEAYLNTFSEPDSVHEFPWNARLVQCRLLFTPSVSEDGRASRYGGPIVIYYDDAGFYMSPQYEFCDGRFERIEN